MAIVNGVIVAGPRLKADIATAFRTSDTRQSFLIGNGHGQIIIWDRYKPTIVPMTVVRTAPNNDDSSLIVVNAALGTKYWQGMDGNCGLLIPQLTKVEQIMDYCDGSLNGWRYLPPTGGTAAPYRDGDMIGYSINVPADNGIGRVSVQGGSFNEGEVGVSVIFGALVPTDVALGFEDFIGLRDCYFGALVHKVGTSGYGFRVIAADMVVNGDTSILLTGQGNGRPVEDTWMGETEGQSPMLGQGKYEIFPFLYSKSRGVYIPIPYVKGGAGSGGASGGLSVEVKPAPQMRVLAWLTGVDDMRATLHVTVSNIPYSNREVSVSVSFWPLDKDIDVNGPPISAEIQYGRPQQFTGTASGNSITWERAILIDGAAWLKGGMQLLAEAGLPGSTGVKTVRVLSQEYWTV